MSIFEKRVAFKPFEYPEVVKYKEAINHSYWLVSEWDFLSDIQDFHVKLSPVERNAIKNALLAISQIEISVKKFWTRIGDHFPKAEMDQVGICFGESEIRHSDAYSHLLEVLGLNNDFTLLLQNPVIQGRVDYLTKYLKGAADNNRENYTLALALFSIFIENVSLFSQFLIIKAFNKYKNVLKDIDNVVQATQKEECYSEDTEVLTQNGWVFLKDIKVGDPVIEFDNGVFRRTNVLRKIEQDYQGEMYRFYSKANECLVTPDHDMVFYNTNDELKKIKAKDFKPHSKQKIVHGGKIDGNNKSNLTFEDRLRIAIQADGSTTKWTNSCGEVKLRGKCGGYTHSFCLTKQRKQERLEWILEQANIQYTKKEDGREIYYKIHYNQDYDYKQFDWVDFSDKSADWCKEFALETVEWDGFKTGVENSFGYSSTNKNAIDVVQTAAIFGGFRTSIRSRKDNRKDTYKECYKLCFRNYDIITAGHGLKREIVPYNGKVYCVTVPSGVIITRRKNRTMIAGNCVHALFGVYLINEIKKECPEWFNDAFYTKIKRACVKAFDAECAIIDWIFEAGELSFLSREEVKEFIKNRFNESLQLIGSEPVFTDVDEKALEKLRWFEEEIYAEVTTDFFHKRPVSYSKKVLPVQAEDLF